MLNVLKEEAKYLLVEVNLTEANLSHAEQFKNELISLLNTKKRSIWLDMAKVTYVDSSFLGALVAALKHAMPMQCDVVLLSPQQDISDLLKLIRLDKVFKMYAGEQDAVQAIG
ncbi:STAS domain-containing protein [Mucilaginibacter sp. PAMB04274]|uniref:STAS domain-containing protein n=1 Tax=Mucilaginibacter sp. PAMB04274 TaxID=3138568 RepID=UPI0031F71688